METANRMKEPIARPASVRSIIFDLDGTLLALERNPSSEAARRWWMATEVPVSFVMLWLDRSGLSRLLRRWIDRGRRLKGIGTLDQLRPVPGAVRLVSRLASEYSLGVVTNRGRREAHGFLHGSGMVRSLSAVVTREDVWLLKPHPAPIRRAIGLLGATPGSTLVVGDLPVDMRAARRAGALAIGVRTGFSTDAELRRAGALVVLDSVRDLPELLERDRNNLEAVL